MYISRDFIIESLKKGLEDCSYVNAFWLEGSDGTGKLDEFSDLDIVLNVADGFEEQALQQLEALLAAIGPLDLNYKEYKNDQQSYTVFHLLNTADSLFLDVSIQSQSHKYTFLREDTSVIPKVIFDKIGIIQYESLNQDKLHNQIQERLYHLENTFKQRGRAIKYAKRNKFLEAFAYYQKFVLTPLVELLRIKYAPIHYDYYLVQASRQLPVEVLDRLEHLYKVNSVTDIEAKIEIAARLFDQTLCEMNSSNHE
ncbi:tetratricopeptide (TPR) repeat protein [Paenibacillus castaneae]|uniref:hypothetical protein n=1 Tax=Paenibacillus castaneae TaxID=474957 RepID=UPI000C9B7AFF|nr:hypothetical protein [Paenibacillus castaneae]NIK80387.1 tetratricopeptide (TPR) repeat protein [Paenibacillus castaneae]